MASKRARENGGDEVAVSWAGGVFKDEFDSGLVKGGVRVPSLLHILCPLSFSLPPGDAFFGGCQSALLSTRNHFFLRKAVVYI